ncbi:MAG: hypothetical protein IT335_06375 [Thermomicrobiales bacterium]|nr:hypothetical protein [Thermomicrobiales bacterium]
METTDFNTSYMTWSAEANLNDTRKPGHMPWGNAARIMIDARCTILDQDGSLADELYLIAPCRTEWMYRETELIQNPSGEYRQIFSEPHALQRSVGKSMIENGPIAHGPATSTNGFTWIRFTIQRRTSRRLPTDQAVVDATVANLPIVAKTRYESNGSIAILEYPIRTMNFHEERGRFQVDTGPIIFPDLDATAERLIDRCYLAHTVYNNFTYAEFVGKQPTPVMVGGAEVASIYHYSFYKNLDVTTELFAQI